MKASIHFISIIHSPIQRTFLSLNFGTSNWQLDIHTNTIALIKALKTAPNKNCRIGQFQFRELPKNFSFVMGKGKIKKKYKNSFNGFALSSFIDKIKRKGQKL